MKVARENSENGQRWKIILLIVLVVAAAGAAWRAAVSMRGERFERAVACAQCGYEGAVEVGEGPSREQWPRECPKCHQKQLYMYHRCPACGKPILMKDPNADKYGNPSLCPYCKARDWSRET